MNLLESVVFRNEINESAVGDPSDLIDHGELDGLTDDDHNPTYYNTSRLNTWFGTKSLADLGTKDHDLLDGLGDDDHTQYLLADGTRALTGDWVAGTGRTITAGTFKAATKFQIDMLSTYRDAIVYDPIGGAMEFGNAAEDIQFQCHDEFDVYLGVSGASEFRVHFGTIGTFKILDESVAGTGGHLALNGDIYMDNAQQLKGEIAAGSTFVNLASISSIDNVLIGQSPYNLYLRGSQVYVGAASGSGINLRIQNDTPMQGEVSATGSWYNLAYIDSSDNAKFGDSSANGAYIYGDSNSIILTSGGLAITSGYLKVTTGDIYLDDNNKKIYGRNAADDAYLDILRIDTSDQLRINESATASLILYGTDVRTINCDHRMYNGYSLAWRNAANTAWRDTLTVDASDRLVIGQASSFAATRIYGSDANYLTIGASISSPYTIYMTTNATYLYGQETGGTNRVLIGMTGANQVRLGQNSNRMIMYSSGNVYLYGAGLRLDNAYYLYGLNQAGTNARTVAGVDASDVCQIGNANWTYLHLQGPYIRYGTSAWDDLRVSANSVRVPGSAAPSWSTFLGSIQALEFVTAPPSNASVHFSCQLPHTYKEGTDIYPHVHWAPDGTNTGNVRWGLEYTWQNIDGTFAAPTTIYVNDAGSGTAYDHQVATFSAITGTGKTISSMLMCRLFRDTDDAADTLTDSAFLLEIDFHHEIDAPGSDQSTSKT